MRIRLEWLFIDAALFEHFPQPVCKLIDELLNSSRGKNDALKSRFVTIVPSLLFAWRYQTEQANELVGNLALPADELMSVSPVNNSNRCVPAKWPA